MPSTYAQTILDARREALALGRDLRRRMAVLLAEALDRAFARYLAGEITEAAARQMVRDIERGLTRYGLQAEGEVRAAMLRAADAGADAHRQALASLVASADAPAFAATFSGVPVEALERLAAARAAGLTYKTLTRYHAQRQAAAINAALDRMVADGDSWQTATRRIMRSLAAGDPYLARVAEDYGPRGGLTRAARLAGVAPDAAAAAVARRLGYDARRIAVTETNAAYREADNLAAARSPVVAGVRWTLSPRHPRWDVCDILARSDFYGLGEGVYPGGEQPVPPHPFCLCYGVPVLRPESEWGRPPESPGPPRVGVIGEARVPAGVTPNARRRAVTAALRGVTEAHRQPARAAA